MEYLIKFSAIITLFYLCYKVLLERETFFGANRWFLLIGLITATLLPYITITTYIEQTPHSIENFKFSGIATDFPIKKTINWLQILNTIYFLGILIFTIRYLMQLTSLIKILSKNKSQNKEGYKYIRTSTSLSPFSFFKWIVYNPSQFNKTELELILNHEKAHAQHYHSIDILLIQLSCIVFWFNPFIWLYNKEIKQNLEFIADETAQKRAISKKSYQYTLLKTSIPTEQLFVVNNFYNSLLKKRITMLHKPESKKVNQYKYILIIPLLIGFVFLFNTEVIAQETSTEIIEDKTETKTPLIIIDGKESTQKTLKAISPGDIYSIDVIKDKKAIDTYGDKGKLGVIIVKTQKKVNINGNKVTKHTIELTEESNPVNSIVIIKGKEPIYEINGIESTKKEALKIKTHEIKSITALRGEPAVKKYGEKGKNGVMVISTKK